MLESFIQRAREENRILERNGAVQAAQARAQLLKDLEEAVASWDEETVTVAEAAQLANVNEETVRRAVRSGEIADNRTNPRGTMRVRVGDLAYLRGKGRARGQVAAYDAVAHAEEYSGLM